MNNSEHEKLYQEIELASQLCGFVLIRELLYFVNSERCCTPINESAIREESRIKIDGNTIH